MSEIRHVAPAILTAPRTFEVSSLSSLQQRLLKIGEPMPLPAKPRPIFEMTDAQLRFLGEIRPVVEQLREAIPEAERCGETAPTLASLAPSPATCGKPVSPARRAKLLESTPHALGVSVVSQADLAKHGVPVAKTILGSDDAPHRAWLSAE